MKKKTAGYIVIGSRGPMHLSSRGHRGMVPTLWQNNPPTLFATRREANRVIQSTILDRRAFLAEIGKSIEDIDKDGWTTRRKFEIYRVECAK